MKIVVDKKIQKIDGDVEDILQTSQIVEDGDGLRVIETPEIPINTNYSISISSLKELHIESDIPIQVNITKQGATVVNLESKREFSFIGQEQYLSITLTNNSAAETEKAKIKIVVVE